MRMAGRFARRVKAWGAAHGVPVIFCEAGERKHAIAEEHLATHAITEPGVFLVLVAKAPATVWKVKRCAQGHITNLEKRREYVNHYSFHILDPDWGHVTIKMSGHPPFGAQVILNGHEYVAAQARRAGIAFSKDGNCFTAVADPAGLAKLRGKHLIDKPGRSRRYHLPPAAARTIAALLTLRDQVIAPILAGVCSPRMGRKPKTWTAIDRDYEQIRIDMHTLFDHLGLTTPLPAQTAA